MPPLYRAMALAAGIGAFSSATWGAEPALGNFTSQDIKLSPRDSARTIGDYVLENGTRTSSQVIRINKGGESITYQSDYTLEIQLNTMEVTATLRRPAILVSPDDVYPSEKAVTSQDTLILEYFASGGKTLILDSHTDGTLRDNEDEFIREAFRVSGAKGWKGAKGKTARKEYSKILNPLAVRVLESITFDIAQ